MSDLSRVEQLLRNALGEDIYEVTPQSRVEVLLQQLNEYIEGMGGGSVDPEVITAWLAENIHDGAVVDSSLTVEGAAADSKKTGTEISQIKEDLSEIEDTVSAVIAGNYTINKVTGNPLVFDDALGGESASAEIVIPFSQSGEGTPSDDNVRPISTYKSLEVLNSAVSPAESTFINLGDDYIASGTVDLAEGVIYTDHWLETIDGSRIGDFSTGYVRITIAKTPQSGNANWEANTKSDRYVAVSNSSSSRGIYLASASGRYVRIYDPRFTSRAIAKSILNDNPVQIYYKLNKQITVAIYKASIPIRNGTNNISSVGNITLSYYADKHINTASAGSNYNLSTDALLYVDRIPSYYISPSENPTSFAEAQSYMDNKINQIPKTGKSFIYITDVHWDGNQMHSTDLINYIRKRTGIQNVLFGGDIFGNATSQYGAMKKASSYMDQAKRAFGYNFIPCVGDHDNNTVNVSKDNDHFLPYAQVEQLFVGDLERRLDYHFYDPSEKLAQYATPGTDDYNGAMSFFHTVYYVDDTEQKIRYIVLNCGNGGMYGAMYNIFGSSGSDLLRLQADWLAETLMSTPTDYDVIVLSHKANIGDSGTARSVINSIIYGFKRKSSNVYPHPSNTQCANIDSWWPNTTSYNMSKAPDVGYVICINGHTHTDYLSYWGTTNGTYSAELSAIANGGTISQPTITSEESVTNFQIPVIRTATDSLGAAEAGSPSMTAGTVTEQCFDVVTLTDDGVVLTRIGAGEDRRFYITK